MRNKYNKEFEKYAKEKSKVLTKEQLRLDLQDKFNIIITKSSLEKYLYRHNIQCKNYNKNKAHTDKRYPVGYEYIKDDGMTLVKVSQPNVWKYKQRLIYEQYYNIKLTDNDFIIFLNQDRTDFRIENLKKITRRESCILSNQKMFSTNENLTELGIITAKLMIKAKEISK